MPEFFTAAVQLGLSAALCVFFVVQGARREKRLSDRLNALEDYQRGMLAKLISAATAALKRNNRIMLLLNRNLKDHETK